jgi:hypothetical protein
LGGCGMDEMMKRKQKIGNKKERKTPDFRTLLFPQKEKKKKKKKKPTTKKKKYFFLANL